MPKKPHKRIDNSPAKKRMRYKEDTAYRERAKALSRRVYRRKAKVEFTPCLYSLEFIDSAATMQNTLLPSGRRAKMPVLSVPQTAKLLQKFYQTVWRWIENGTIPGPVLECVAHETTCYRVYHAAEVRVLIEEIGKHEQEMRYLRKDHVQARERIERRILAIRTKLGILGE